MYAKYFWKAGSQAAQVLSDLVAMMTSVSPDINTLSASCDKTLTSVVANTVNSNWTVHDAAAGANLVCLKSLNADGVTYKYVTLGVLATPSIQIKAYENWNATTHTGLNVSSSMATAIPVTLTNSGYINFIATDRNIGIINNPMAGAQYNLVTEFSRGGFLIDNTYPCIVAFDNSSSLCQNTNGSSGYISPAYIGICRTKNPAIQVGDLTGATSSFAGPMTGLLLNPTTPLTATSQTGGSFGVDGVKRLLAFPIHLIVTSSTPAQASTIGYLGEVLGSICVAPATGIAISILDEIVIGSTTFIIIASNGGNALLFPKV